MAEMEVRGMFVETETLKMPQLKYLRQYHATSLIKDGVIQVKKSRAEVCMAAALHVCTFQKLAVEGSLYPEVTVLSWVQCDHCNGWLHTDCAGVQEKSLKGSFNCGCQLPLQRSFDRTRVALQQKGIGGLIEDSGIVDLHDALLSRQQRSCRMYLWEHPETSLRLKQLCKPRSLFFSEDDTNQLAEKIKRALKLSDDPDMVNFMFDIMIPEVTIKILMTHEGFCRYKAELCLQSGNLTP
ncbi:uncharacterized protein [Paramormyrops kingsleyae]|uniref:uncharacterized protein n=1 Tax=Paramormyrops kingsleyae TaxID=1676925 RepID=UPI003B9797CF